MKDISQKLKGVVIARGFGGGLDIASYTDEGAVTIMLSPSILEKYKDEILTVLNLIK
jgi:hypothetical protein